MKMIHYNYQNLKIILDNLKRIYHFEIMIDIFNGHTIRVRMDSKCTYQF